MNTDGVVLERPVHPEAGNDRQTRVTHAGLRALVDDDEQFVRAPGATSVERIVITRIRIQPRDANGNLIDVQAGDFVEYPDYRGVRQRRRVTSVVTPFVLGSVDHIVISADPT